MIVAINYVGETRRDHDYLPKPPELVIEILANGQTNPPPRYGHADEFLQFIEAELKPMIEQRFSIDR